MSYACAQTHTHIGLFIVETFTVTQLLMSDYSKKGRQFSEGTHAYSRSLALLLYRTENEALSSFVKLKRVSRFTNDNRTRKVDQVHHSTG